MKCVQDFDYEARDSLAYHSPVSWEEPEHGHECPWILFLHVYCSVLLVSLRSSWRCFPSHRNVGSSSTDWLMCPRPLGKSTLRPLVVPRLDTSIVSTWTRLLPLNARIKDGHALSMTINHDFGPSKIIFGNNNKDVYRNSFQVVFSHVQGPQAMVPSV